jgi:ribosomal protein S18 acetylase RimI-like enzyme
MNIDRATLSDVRAVAEIHVEAWRSAYSRILPADYLASLSVEQREAMWKKTIESEQPELLVAKDDGNVLGWVLFGTCRDEEATSSQAELWAIYVAPSSWFKGIGRQLWQQARDRLSLRGYTECSLWVFPENEQAIRFYRSIGFVADNLPPKQFELGGRQLQEVRYVYRL